MAKKVISAIAILAIAMWSFGFPTWVPHSQAAALTSISDTLSDSDLGVVSNHTITFSNETIINEGDTVAITFAAGFDVTGTVTLGLEDFDVNIGSEMSLAYDCSTGSENWSVATSGQTVTFTVCAGDGGAVSAGGTTTIEIGTNASTAGTGDTQIINPIAAGPAAVDVVTTSDSGSTLVAIIDDVVISAAVDTSFIFSINGLPAGLTVNGGATTTGVTTLPTSIPFGTITAGPTGGVVAAQNLRVTTNAANGFTVTAQTDQALTSSTGADIDTFANGGASSTPVAWEGPVGQLNNENTYGHMGITSEDATLSGGDTFGTDLWVGDYVASPREVFYHDGPTDGVTTDQGSTTIGFQVEISSLQEAGSDYTANLTYVATPVF